MDGGDGLGDGDELVVGGDRQPRRRRPRSAPGRRRCARRRPGRGRPAVRPAATPRRAASARRSRARSTSAAGPADRPRSRRRPAAPTSSDPAISTGCVSGTGRPSRTARQTRVDEEGDGELQPEPAHAVRHEVGQRLVAAAGGERRVDEAHRRAGAGREQRRREHGVVVVVEPLVGGEVGAADRHDGARRPRRARPRTRSRGCRGRTPSAAAGVVAPAPPHRRPRPPRRARRWCRSRARRRRPRAGGAPNTAGVSDDSGSVTTRVPPSRAQARSCSVCSSSRSSASTSATSSSASGSPDRQLDIGAEILEQRHERARCHRARPIAGRAVARRWGVPAAARTPTNPIPMAPATIVPRDGTAIRPARPARGRRARGSARLPRRR